MMKTKKLFASLLAGILLLSSCSNTTVDENENEETLQMEVSTEAPEVNPAKHEISVDEVNSILVANGLQTNINRGPAYPIYHGGHQMRICHTERGTYVAFAKGFADQCFYVAKIAPDNTVTLLHCGEFGEDGSVPVNIGQDINGDIVVSSSSSSTLFMYIFDKDTDEVTEYSTPYTFASVAYAYPGYAQTMFDFVNRKVYVFYSGGLFTGNYEMEWFTFDLETKTWLDGSICHSIEGIGRHCYLFPLPDGNGGAYIVAERDILIETVGDQLQNVSGQTYLWDELKLFHIPDLTSTENITYTTIHEAYSERGHEGIWSSITNNQSGGVFMDADGYLHITYRFTLGNLTGQPMELDTNTHFRHAIYDGMECIFNEKLDLQGGKPQIVQNTDGTLFMIVSQQRATPSPIDIYKAEDSLGKTWHLETTLTFEEKIYDSSFSISEARSGSTQDNTIGCFYYYYSGVNTGCAFTISLDDYSVTPIVDLFAGYNLRIDERVDKRAHNTAHQTKIVHTENGTYAAFVYDHNNGVEYFHIAKIDSEKNATILHSDSFTSGQDKYLTIQRTADGQIYVCPPTGTTIYHIDQKTDAVTSLEITQSARYFGTLKQAHFSVPDAEGNGYMLCFKEDDTFPLISYPYNPANMTLYPIKNTFDATLKKSVDSSIKYVPDTDSFSLTNYEYPYILEDGNGGAYVVLTREVDKDFLREKLQYSGYIHVFNDSIMLLHIPDLSATDTEWTEVQAPYEAEGNEGIWSVVNVADNGDVYLDSDGKIHILYSSYHYDFDDLDRKGNDKPLPDTLKYHHAVYDGVSLVSTEEVNIAGLTENTSVRMAETTDGTLYLLVCNIGEENTKIDLYCEADNGWVLCQTKALGEFSAESFSISGPRGGSVQNNTVDCIVYAADNDVYFTSVTFE